MSSLNVENHSGFFKAYARSCLSSQNSWIVFFFFILVTVNQVLKSQSEKMISLSLCLYFSTSLTQAKMSFPVRRIALAPACVDLIPHTACTLSWPRCSHLWKLSEDFEVILLDCFRELVSRPLLLFVFILT